MIPKIIKTLFLALGLVMIWLGIFYSYELEKQPAEEAYESIPLPKSGQLETYTLSNDSYSEKAVKELEFRNLGNEESTLIFRLKDMPESEKAPERMNTAGFAEEFEALERSTESSGAGNFPMLLACGGIAFLGFGFFSFRLEQQKKQAL